MAVAEGFLLMKNLFRKKYMKVSQFIGQRAQLKTGLVELNL